MTLERCKYKYNVLWIGETQCSVVAELNSFDSPDLCSPYHGAICSAMIGHYTAVLHSLHYGATVLQCTLCVETIINNCMLIIQYWCSTNRPSLSTFANIPLFGICSGNFEVDVLFSPYCRAVFSVVLC